MNDIKKGKNISIVMFALLYMLDIYILYNITEDVSATVFGGIVIFLVILLLMKLAVLSLSVTPISNYPNRKAAFLMECFEEVINRSYDIGNKKNNINLYIADNTSLNACAVGNSIIVNRGLLELGDSSMIEAVLGHELSHVIKYDTWFKTLLEINIFAGLCGISITFMLTSIILVLIFSIIFGIVTSSWVGFTVGSMMSKVLKGLYNVIQHLFYYLSKIFSTFLYRQQEKIADSYTARLGYAYSMMRFLNLIERSDRTSFQSNWIQLLMSDHPSNTRRIAMLEKIQEEIDSDMNNQYEITKIENPFK